MSENIIQLEYYLIFDSGEKSETFEWDEALSHDELEAYNEFITFSQSIDDAPLLKKVIDRVENEILEGNLDDFVLDESGYKLHVIIPDKT